MAQLSVAARSKVWRGLMRWWSKRGLEIGDFSKHDLYDPGTNTGAVADADDWLDSATGNPAPVSGYNGALPDPFKSNAALLLKSELLLILASVRTAQEAGIDAGEYARRIMGVEVD